MSDVKLVSDAQALQSMRASDFDVHSAYGEVVDNALQADAKNIRIRLESRQGRGKAEPLISVAFADDGHGMSPETLQQCLQLGYSSRFNDRKGIGRFGVGVTLAAINQCKRVELYSRMSGEDWHFVYVDLDEIASGSQGGIPIPVRREPPEELMPLLGEGSGTLMVWKKHDKQDAPASRIREEFKIWAGRTYRYFIWEGVDLFIDGEPIPAIDPLFVRTARTRFPGDPPAYEYEQQMLRWPVPSRIDVLGEDVPEESEITIRLSLLDESFRSSQGRGGSAKVRDRFIHHNEGLSIVRNKREVFYGHVPWWPGDKFQEIDRWWGGEVAFDAVLDYSFSVRNIKRGAVPLGELKKLLSDKIEPTRKTALQEVRRVWTKAAKAEEQHKTERHKRAEEIAKRHDNALPKSQKRQEMTEEETESLIDAILQGKSAEERARWRERFRSQPFVIDEDTWRGSEFLEIKHLGGQDVLIYNNGHRFHRVLDTISKQIQGSDSSQAAGTLRALVDLLLISYAKAESMLPDEHAASTEQLRSFWGNFLREYMKGLESDGYK